MQDAGCGARMSVPCLRHPASFLFVAALVNRYDDGMEASDRDPVTDSPWFWVMLFSLMALGALAAIGGKYGRRQAVIERQYQARTRVAEQKVNANNPAGDIRIDEQGTSRAFATPGDTLIPLWPLAAVLILVALFAGVMLFRGRGRPGSLADEHPLS